MFVRECLLRNVGEAKMHVIYELTKRGYSPMYMKFENNVGGNNMVCEGQTWHCTDSDNKPHCIDCGENIDLFLAIAALRDDTDYMQWFTNGNEWFQNKQNDIEVIIYGPNTPINFRKATINELIEFFTKPKNEGFLSTKTLKRINEFEVGASYRR